MAPAALRVVEGASMDKSKALDAALSQIERNFGKGSIMKLGKKDKNALDIEVVSTGSLGLDIALGVGGLPRGRIVEIYGPESSGKTTLTLSVIAEMQKQGGVCAICKRVPPSLRLNIDHEHVKGWKKMPPEQRKQYVRGLLCFQCNRLCLQKSNNLSISYVKFDVLMANPVDFIFSMEYLKL